MTQPVVPPPVIPPQVQAPLAPVVLTVTALPAELQALSTSQTLQATVISLPNMQTANLQLTLPLSGETAMLPVIDAQAQTPVSLQQGQLLSLKPLQINADGSLSLRLTGLNGKPLGPSNPPPPFLASESTTSGAHTPGSTQAGLATTGQNGTQNSLTTGINRTDTITVGKSHILTATVVRGGRGATMQNSQAPTNWVNLLKSPLQNKNAPVFETGTSLSVKVTAIKPALQGTQALQSTPTQQTGAGQSSTNITAQAAQQGVSSTGTKAPITGNTAQTGLQNTAAAQGEQNTVNNTIGEQNSLKNAFGRTRGLGRTSPAQTGGTQAGNAIKQPPTQATPNTAVPGSPGGVNPATLSGEVLRQTPEQTLIKAGDNTISLPLKTPLDEGTRIEMDILGRSAPSRSSGAPAQPERIISNAAGWPALSEALEILEARDPVAAQQLANAIPRPGPRLAVNMVAFMQAVKTGNINNWVPETPLQALDKAGAPGKAATGKLAKDIRELGKRSAEQGKDWKSVDMPFHAGTTISRINAIVRRYAESEEQSGKKNKRGPAQGATRFVININLSRLGPLQFDGLAYENDHKFDLVVRTQKPVPAKIQADVKQIFTDSLAATGYAGTLRITGDEKFFDPVGVDIPETPADEIVI